MSYKVPNIYGKTVSKKISVNVPGSKSITARALLIAAIAHGESELSGVQYGDDCSTFIECLKSLGISVKSQGDTLRITGCGGKLDLKEAKAYVGAAGTAARFLPAFLAFQDGRYFLDCSEQMKRRPVSPLINALRGAGASFSFEGKESSYPFSIKGPVKTPAEFSVDISGSSQFLSALLISAVCSEKPVKINAQGIHGLNYVEMTLKMVRSFGASATGGDGVYRVEGEYTGRKYAIEPDVSAACYFYAANKILGTDIEVNGVKSDSMQGDYRFIELLKSFDGGTVDMGAFSDQTLTLAAIAPYFSKPTAITGVAHIRGQECDRISAIVQNLRAMQVPCEERTDGVKIYPCDPRPAKLKTFGDHRVAMSFALTGLRADGIEIENPEVCAKTFKDYFKTLDYLCGNLTRGTD